MEIKLDRVNLRVNLIVLYKNSRIGKVFVERLEFIELFTLHNGRCVYKRGSVIIVVDYCSLIDADCYLSFQVSSIILFLLQFPSLHFW